MRSLDEMRPKIVELTDAKLDLAEQVQSAQRALKERDTIIEKLEASVDEYQSKEADSVKKWKEALASKEREAGSVHTDFAELQNNYNQLQEELDTALASIKTLEAQRTTQHQEASRRVLEIDRLNEAAQAQLEELSNVRDELDARRSAQVRFAPAVTNCLKLSCVYRTKSKESWSVYRTS
ncbi:hypothetical protein FA15DRAFT_266993 [Coprinopsis marcescibilis]|uniref:Uncharacterized protein n=1 Tax=Coprinopsis marcescibilis TaxID=230819 RepID=A0A5C3L2F5_COPMA|nr:hypothetical protein FA15DRAFT_266993 [Coprinopsis marcescibilis]